ncbi:hypothetical protein A2U01_0107305, partial [Trifolium medium]|nr:hypothetical protein [Trifolium medium]
DDILSEVVWIGRGDKESGESSSEVVTVGMLCGDGDW